MARTKYSTYMSIKTRLLEMFKTTTFERNKLPSEPALAKDLGISLVNLREALLMLALEGYITKRHGSGNYIHPSALDFENRSLYFADCLEKDGYETFVMIVDQKIVRANALLSSVFGIEKGAPVVQNHIVYRTDEQPAIYTVMNIPKSLLVDGDIKKLKIDLLHDFVFRYCGRELAHSLNEYFPMALDSHASRMLNLPAKTPVIGCRQTFYDITDTPIQYNEHRFHPKFYRLRTLQNWDFAH